MRTIWGKYSVDSNLIGAGAYGKVYKANDPSGRLLAIKENSNRELARLEARIMQRYRQAKFLPRYYDYFEIENKNYLVSEYIPGSTLGGNSFQPAVSFKRDQNLSVKITINILKGLRQLHKLGYVHNDLLPQNIMIQRYKPGTVKVIDFTAVKEITGPDILIKELQDVCKICVFLMNGTLSDIRTAEIRDSALRSVLLNPFDLEHKVKYRSADELIAALRPFG